MINVKALPIVDAFTSNGQPLVAILGPNHEVYWEAVKKMEGILPLIFESRKGGPLKEYKIYGNTPYQEWTPSPEKERTANLFCPPSPYGISIQTGEVDTNTGRKHGDDFVEVRPNVTYHIKFDAITTSPTDCNFWIIGYDENKQIITDGTYNATYKGSLFNSTISKNATNHPFVTSPTTKYIRWYTTSIPTNWDEMSPMLNEGSTALPYEPYGYREKSGPCEVKGVGERTGNLLDISTDKWIKRIPADDVIVEGNTVTVKADYFDYVIAKLKPNTDYYIKWKSQYSTKRVGVAIATVFNGKYATVIRNASTVPFTFNTAENTEIAFLFYAGSGSAGETKYSEIMLNEGSEPLPYEPYGYKTTVVDEGKNLWKNDFSQFDNVGGTGTSYTYFKLPTNDIYEIKLTAKNDVDSTGYFLGFSAYGGFAAGGEVTGEVSWIIKNGIGCEKGFVITQKNTSKTPFVSMHPKTAEVFNWLVSNFDIQLELGSTATEYAPYRTPIETTIYHDEPYFTNDYISKDKDGGVEHREWKKKVFDGSEKITKDSPAKQWMFYYLPGNLKQGNAAGLYAYSTHFERNYSTWGSINGKNEIITNSNSIIFSIDNADTSIDDFKAWLKSEYDAGHPVTVYYQLATPTDTPKDLPDIVTASGYNSIDTDTQIKPEKMEIAYR